jgi:hypothetical protein
MASSLYPNAAERDCPWCAETIKAKAIICRFCGRDVEPTSGWTSTLDPTAGLPTSEPTVPLPPPSSEQQSASRSKADSEHQRILQGYPDCGQSVWDASLRIPSSQWPEDRYRALEDACALVRRGLSPRDAVERTVRRSGPPAPPIAQPRASAVDADLPFTAVPGLSPLLTGWLVGLFGVSAAAAVGAAATGLKALRDYNTVLSSWANRGTRVDRWVSSDNVFVGTSLLFIAVWIATFVLLLVWMYKAHKATQHLWAGHRQWGAGWTIGGWFIPAAQFVIPKLVLNEIERIARSPRTAAGGAEEPHRRVPTAASGWAWWLLVAAGLIATRAAGALSATRTTLASEVRIHYILATAGFGAIAIGLLFGMAFVQGLGRLLAET